MSYLLFRCFNAGSEPTVKITDVAQLVKNVTTNTSTVTVGGERGDQTHLVVMMVIGAVMVVLGLVLLCRYLTTKCSQVRRASAPAFYNRFSGLAAKEDSDHILASEELEADTYHSQFRVEAFNLAASSDSSGATSPSLTPSPREENPASSSTSSVLERVRGGLGFTTTGWQRF